MKEITLLQVDISRIIIVYVIQGVVAIYFSIMAYQIIRRRRQRLNIIFGAFFISVCIGNVLNMIYAVIPLHLVLIIEILHLLTLFFIFFSIIFIPIVNMIILESTLIYSVKRQNRHIILYGFLLFFGMLLLLIIQEIFGLDWIGFEIDKLSGYPRWGPIFFLYITLITFGFGVIPIISTNWKIYKSFEAGELKRKWRFYFIGSLGVFSVAYSIMIANSLRYFGVLWFSAVISFAGISIVLWAQLMYYGIGSKLKK
ncbi:MAG: hypothetical protein ACFFDN_47830 [Candidatus Hodarchaeota archaeon]